MGGMGKATGTLKTISENNNKKSTVLFVPLQMTYSENVFSQQLATSYNSLHVEKKITRSKIDASYTKEQSNNKEILNIIFTDVRSLTGQFHD